MEYPKHFSKTELQALHFNILNLHLTLHLRIYHKGCKINKIIYIYKFSLLNNIIT